MQLSACISHSINLALLILFIAFSCSAFELNIDSTLHSCDNRATKNNSELDIDHTIVDCRHKIRLTLNIKNSDKTPEEVKYVFVKDVVDADSGIKLRLLNPIAVRFRQEQVLLAYPMKYLTAVNARATEYVINYENRKNFTGCDDESPINPSCGIKHENGATVEYSQGFCCFCPTAPTKGKQARGGQDCSLVAPPASDIDLAAYKASAHCLKKSDAWYTVNALSEPDIIHQTYLQVYNQRHLVNGSSVWVALTGEEDFALGPKNPYQYDDNGTIVITHATEKPVTSSITLAYDHNRILVPQPILGTEPTELPTALKNGANDYLILANDVINSDGLECDKAGVSYEGFALQNDRCDVPRNTCLKNQPLDFWENDNQKEQSGTKGTHLLKNYGVPYKDPIIVDQETQEHWLALEYYNVQHTTVRIDMNANNIISLKVGKYAMVLSVVTEGASNGITFRVAVQNSGLVSAEFSVEAVNCGYSVPDSNSLTKIIPPQLQESFVVMTKPGTIQLTEKFKCNVEVKSAAYGLVAKRKVSVKPKTRCICNFHCLCVCLGESLYCQPMTEKDYHDAGFRGSLPVLTAKPEHKPWIVKNPLVAVTLFLLTLLLFGFIKAALGIVGIDVVGEGGLSSILYKPKKIGRYPEPELQNIPVEYDSDGFPLHPDSGLRYKTYTRKFLFLLNCGFCFYWPCHWIFQAMGQSHQRDGYEDIPLDDNMETEVVVDSDHVNHMESNISLRGDLYASSSLISNAPGEPYHRGSVPGIVHDSDNDYEDVVVPPNQFRGTASSIH